MINLKSNQVRGAIISFFILSAFLFLLQKQLLDIYDSRNSFIVSDRNNKEIYVVANKNKYYARYADNIPARLKELLIKKEDKYFYLHSGFNPISILKAISGRIGFSSRTASSTITQQLVKILLSNESKRSYGNKLIEFIYSISLEIFQSKENILKMYANSIYFGNQSQGITEASRIYFNLAPELLSDSQIIQLLSAIQSPTETNPSEPGNIKMASGLAERLGTDENFLKPTEIKANMANYDRFQPSYFELNQIGRYRKTTIDSGLNEKIRKILNDKITELESKNIKNGAVVVIKLPENEVLSLIGSPDPNSSLEGNKINMLERARPIGSTIKPFIYLKGFEMGLRPYSYVLDKEYKYITAIGFPLYPKNFDYKYRGQTTLHYSLSNSLNVPSVKTLEFVGLNNFYDFLENDLGFTPAQDLDNYQLGIALGSLEMNLYNLCHYFTIFPNKGILKGVKLDMGESQNSVKKIADEKYIQLINKVLSDRKTGVEQFGLKSNLNLFQANYALKTGTSRDFKDSWIIGYTPDFLVGVWLGNHDNSSSDEVSGQIGAGAIWAKIMQLLMNSNYNKKTEFNFDLLQEYTNQKGESDFGLAGDDYQKSLNLLIKGDTDLISLPHEDDVFLGESQTDIILQSKENVKWYVNNIFISEGKDSSFPAPLTAQKIEIKAVSPSGQSEIVNIFITEE